MRAAKWSPDARDACARAPATSRKSDKCCRWCCSIAPIASFASITNVAAASIVIEANSLCMAAAELEIRT